MQCPIYAFVVLVGLASGPAPAAPATPEEEVNQARLEVARAETAQAKAEKELAEFKEDKAKEAEEESELSLDGVRSGKLIQYGITGGVAPVMHVPLHHHKGAGVGISASGMAYLMLHPQYWRDRPQQSTYCANHWALKGSQAAASRKADATALERAKVRRDSLYALLRVHPDVTFDELQRATDESSADRMALRLLRKLEKIAKRAERKNDPERVNEIETKLKELQESELLWTSLNLAIDRVLNARTMNGKRVEARKSLNAEAPGRYDLKGVTEDQLETARAIVAAKAKGDSTIARKFGSDTVELSLKAAEDALAREMQATVVGWKSDIQARCGLHRFAGAWIGYPFPNFKVTVPQRFENGGVARNRLDVTPIAAAGFGISPNAYFSALAGVSLGLANLEPGDNDDEVVATFVLGLGGNLDLFTIVRGISQ